MLITDEKVKLSHAKTRPHLSHGNTVSMSELTCNGTRSTRQGLELLPLHPISLFLETIANSKCISRKEWLTVARSRF